MDGFSFVCIALASLSSIAATFCVVVCVRVRRELREAALAWQQSPQRSVQSLLESHTEELTNLANRVKMMKVRRASNHTDRNGELPDAYRDPDAWRAAMNARIAASKVPALRQN